MDGDRRCHVKLNKTEGEEQMLDDALMWHINNAWYGYLRKPLNFHNRNQDYQNVWRAAEEWVWKRYHTSDTGHRWRVFDTLVVVEV